MIDTNKNVRMWKGMRLQQPHKLCLANVYSMGLSSKFWQGSVRTKLKYKSFSLCTVFHDKLTYDTGQKASWPTQMPCLDRQRSRTQGCSRFICLPLQEGHPVAMDGTDGILEASCAWRHQWVAQWGQALLDLLECPSAVSREYANVTNEWDQHHRSSIRNVLSSCKQQQTWKKNCEKNSFWKGIFNWFCLYFVLTLRWITEKTLSWHKGHT